MNSHIPHIPMFAITGGPCAGKTTALAFLVAKLSDFGYSPIVVPEASTQLIPNNISPETFPNEQFQNFIIERCMHLEYMARQAAITLLDRNPVILCDRGIPDSRSYTSHATYVKLLQKNGLGSLTEVRDARYDGVFHMRTAALGAEEFYTLANNSARSETIEEAIERDAATLEAWNGAPHLRIIQNDTDFEGKMNRLLREVCASLGIPVPLEIERRYRLGSLDLSSIPVDIQTINIQQAYLQNTDGRQLRVRERGQHGSYVYFETEKQEITAEKRIEIEHIITQRDYLRSLRHRDPERAILDKLRHCFIYDHQYFELDQFPGDEDPILEIEITEENDRIDLPTFLDIKEDVTEDRSYSNYERAGRLAKAA